MHFACVVSGTLAEQFRRRDVAEKPKFLISFTPCLIVWLRVVRKTLLSCLVRTFLIVCVGHKSCFLCSPCEQKCKKQSHKIVDFEN